MDHFKLLLTEPTEEMKKAHLEKIHSSSFLKDWERQTDAMKNLEVLSRVREKSKFKRKAKGPNPLSCKKKIIKPPLEKKQGIKKKRPRRKSKTN